MLTSQVDRWWRNKLLIGFEAMSLGVGMCALATLGVPRVQSADLEGYICTYKSCPSCRDTTGGFCLPVGTVFEGCDKHSYYDKCNWKRPLADHHCSGPNYAGGTCANQNGVATGTNCDYSELVCTNTSPPQ